MARQYTKGLHDIGNGCYAWLQPDGGWGFSNSGLIVDGGETLLVPEAPRGATTLAIERATGDVLRLAR